MSVTLFFNEVKLRPEHYEISQEEAARRVKKAGNGYYILISHPPSHRISAIYNSVGNIWKTTIQVIYEASINTFLWQDTSDKKRTYYSLMSLLETSPRFLFPYTPWVHESGFIPRFFSPQMEKILCKEANGSYFITEALIYPFTIEVFFIENSVLSSELMAWSHQTFESDLKKLQEYPPLRKPLCLSLLSKMSKRSKEPLQTSPSKVQKTKSLKPTVN